MKTLMSILVLTFLTVSANANPVMNWFETEKQKTIEFQKKGWADGKAQLANTKQSIIDLFNKVKKNVTQN
tara:strand:+ start:3705 stop:3914 length:210 start_codon:yes stop_codon:yes gene_type:complete